jgi:hypothetical protein
MELNEPIGIQVQADIEKNGILQKLYKKKNIIILVFIVIIVILSLLLLFKGDKSQNSNTKLIITPPIAIITVTPVLPKSHWSSESAVLKIENDNRNLGNDLLNVDLVESALSLPNIDTNVNFQK